jgi:ribulose-5-phosphate 4-epimerase/fuculose-1-phosphate aldolase
LLPLTQNALLVLPQLAYHNYEGVALNLDERERLVRDIGDKKLMLLRNHGTLAVGATAAEAFIGIYFLERACAQQVNALSGGKESVLIAPDAAQEETRGQSAGLGMVSGLAWPGLKRKLDRDLPGYDS